VDLRDPEFLEWVVRRNVELKCQLMERDPRELHEGMVLQYGHTVGHAVEHLSGYRLTHGEAVAIGMMAASRVGRLLGACGEELVDVHRRLLCRYDLPTELPDDIDDDAIVDAIRSDKRYLVEGIRMALLDRPGRLWSVDGEHAIPVPEDVLARALAETRECSVATRHS
jgi:3-dehydroquinate synthase